MFQHGTIVKLLYVTKYYKLFSEAIDSSKQNLFLRVIFSLTAVNIFYTTQPYICP